MSEPRKRKKVVIRLTPRQKNDPESIIAAVRLAIRECGKTLELRTIPEEVIDPPEKRLAFEELETVVCTAVQEALEAKNEETAKSPPPAPDPRGKSTWWEMVKGLGKWMGDCIIAYGWKILVDKEAAKKVSVSLSSRSPGVSMTAIEQFGLFSYRISLRRDIHDDAYEMDLEQMERGESIDRETGSHSLKFWTAPRYARTSVVFILAGVGLAAMAATGFDKAFYGFAGIAFLGAFGFLMRDVSILHSHGGRLMRVLENIRRAIAFEEPLTKVK